MKPIAMMLFFAATLLGIRAISAQQPADKERDKLVGTWVGWAVKGKGERPERMGIKIELVITKDTIQGFTFKGQERTDSGDGTYSIKIDNGQFHLDGDKKFPNPNRKEPWLGIYELDGDSLRWCVGRKKRPPEFDGKDDAFLLILKRQPK